MFGHNVFKHSYRYLEQAGLLLFVCVGVIVLGRNAMIRPVNSETAALVADLNVLATHMPHQGWAPMTVYFSAFGSTAGAGSINRYEWDLDGNGTFETDATAGSGYVNYTYSKPGIYVVSLRITDGQGQTAVDQVTVTVRHPAASSVDYENLFDDSRVRRVDFFVTQANWNQMWVQPDAKVMVPADVILFGERLDNVGLQMRGQFSLRESGDKKPWKIDTDAFVAGQEFHNLKQLIFINGVGDPSLLQEKLSYDLMHLAGVPASHAAFVEIWIDVTDDDAEPIFWGVYTMVERIDRKFLANRFGPDNEDGNLYKASHAQRGPMDLVYYGPQIEDYPTQNGQVAYGKMTNEEAADYNDIINLCYVIDGVQYESTADFVSAVEQQLNVDGFLRYMAVVNMSMNWDIYPNTGNNYYLYHHPQTDQFEWIPWDLSWGHDAQHPIFELEGPRLVHQAPLHTHVFTVPAYRRQYAAYVDLLNRVWFTPENGVAQIQAYHTLIAPYVTQSTGDKGFMGERAMFPLELFQHSAADLTRLVQARHIFVTAELAETVNSDQ